jgi:murein DD-endopeptidase MepM/ murein hydrolase activator NlpD
VLAVELVLDRDSRIAGLRLAPRTPLPPDPAAGYRPQNRLRLPLLGTWWVVWGGPDERRNYHVRSPDQRHAYDLVRWRRGATHRGSGARNSHYYGWNRRVVAPAAGVVVGARDGVRDNRPGRELENAADAAGNHVLLDLGRGEYALLAHLRRGTVRVRVGDRVRAGRTLGRVGNSGNSSEPHLHFHVQDTPRVLEGIGLPVRFRRIVVDGRARPRATPEQAQFVAPAP